VQTALEMRAKGYAWPAIYPKAISDLMGLSDRAARSKAKRKLRGNVAALKRARKKRAADKKGGTHLKR
jgi:hypothetical protein